MQQGQTNLVPSRPLSDREFALMDGLLARLPQFAILRQQLPYLRVVEQYSLSDPSDDPSITLEPLDGAPKSDIEHGWGLVETEYWDTDGMTVLVFLHVVRGYLWEMEVVRMDGEALQSFPVASDLRILEPGGLRGPEQT